MLPILPQLALLCLLQSELLPDDGFSIQVYPETILINGPFSQQQILVVHQKNGVAVANITHLCALRIENNLIGKLNT